jgi:hypothetical protein
VLLVQQLFMCLRKWVVLLDFEGRNTAGHDLHLTFVKVPSLAKTSSKAVHTTEVFRLPRFVSNAVFCAFPSFESSLVGEAAVS